VTKWEDDDEIIEIDLTDQIRKRSPTLRKQNINLSHLNPFSPHLPHRAPFPVQDLLANLVETAMTSVDINQLKRRSDPTLSLLPMLSQDGNLGTPNVEKTTITTPFGEMHMMVISGSYSTDSKIF
jgi:hypothetical protein